MHDAELRRGEADADGVVHDLAHPPDLVAQALVEGLDRPRVRAQHRVAVLADLGQGGSSATRCCARRRGSSRSSTRS